MGAVDLRGEPTIELLDSEILVELPSAGEAEAPLGQVALARPRRTIGPYEVIAELARGGMGIVWLCRRTGEAGFERLFAVKVMHEHLAGSPDFIAMLVDEARLAARIHHHNVASVLELGHANGAHYLVMAYVEGCSLAQLMARNPAYRPPSLIVPVMIATLNGLHAAHQVEEEDGRLARLVHRDVSPENILIGVDGDARLTDFGIAKARARMTSTNPGTVKGKLGYCAPELLRDPDAVDQRADVFSAGAVLWGALTGRALFRGDTDGETIHRVLSADVPPPSSVGHTPPVAFDAVALKALARTPAQRFASAAEMAEALRDAALSVGMLGNPTRVAQWVVETFATELEERHRLIRAAARASQSTPIALPRFAPPAKPTPAPGRSLAASEHPGPATLVDKVRFLGAVALALVAGALLTLWLRGFL